VENDL